MQVGCRSVGTERRSRACPRKYTIVTSFMFSVHNISVCDCLLTSQSFGVAEMRNEGWGLLMVCVKLIFLVLFYIYIYFFGWGGSVCACVCVCDGVS